MDKEIDEIRAAYDRSFDKAAPPAPKPAKAVTPVADEVVKAG